MPTYIYDGSLVMGNLMNAAADLGYAAAPLKAAAPRKDDYVYYVR